MLVSAQTSNSIYLISESIRTEINVVATGQMRFVARAQTSEFMRARSSFFENRDRGLTNICEIVVENGMKSSNWSAMRHDNDVFWKHVIF
jgi:hypothetical protein